jgi:hypothetical protein
LKRKGIVKHHSKLSEAAAAKDTMIGGQSVSGIQKTSVSILRPKVEYFT